MYSFIIVETGNQADIKAGWSRELWDRLPCSLLIVVIASKPLNSLVHLCVHSLICVTSCVISLMRTQAILDSLQHDLVLWYRQQLYFQIRSQPEIMGSRYSPYLSGRRDTTESLTDLEFVVPCFKSQQCPFLPVVSFGNGDLHFPYDEAPYSLLERS